MSVAALACALLYTSLDETVPQTSREAATEGRPKRDAQADSAEGEERELWLELLADRRWRAACVTYVTHVTHTNYVTYVIYVTGGP